MLKAKTRKLDCLKEIVVEIGTLKAILVRAQKEKRSAVEKLLAQRRKSRYSTRNTVAKNVHVKAASGEVSG